MRRFRAEPGSDRWLDRLTVIAVALRDPRQVLGLCEDLCQEGVPLDILVNNAAQTVRRPPEAYALLAAGEHDALPDGVRRAAGVAGSNPAGGTETHLVGGPSVRRTEGPLSLVAPMRCARRLEICRGCPVLRRGWLAEARRNYPAARGAEFSARINCGVSSSPARSARTAIS
ncbi:hypothetical protein QFZ32_001621 [Streptomyces canus]|nr:hypothetical protein [Streptomyces canus]